MSYQQHIVIVDAIRQRDPDKADRAWQTHLNSVSATPHALGKSQKCGSDRASDPSLVKQIAL